MCQVSKVYAYICTCEYETCSVKVLTIAIHAAAVVQKNEVNLEKTNGSMSPETAQQVSGLRNPS